MKVKVKVKEIESITWYKLKQNLNDVDYYDRWLVRSIISEMFDIYWHNVTDFYINKISRYFFMFSFNYKEHNINIALRTDMEEPPKTVDFNITGEEKEKEITNEDMFLDFSNLMSSHSHTAVQFTGEKISATSGNWMIVDPGTYQLLYGGDAHYGVDDDND